MASSARVAFFSPSSMLVTTLFCSLVLFVGLLLSSIFINEEKSKKLVQYEIGILLKNNGALIKGGKLREFSQLIPGSDDWLLNVFNFRTKDTFVTGNSSLAMNGVCSRSDYYEFEVNFCREKIIPWQSIITISIAFLVLLLVALVVAIDSNKRILRALKSILKSASIDFGANLNISSAWKLVDDLAEEISIFRKKELDFEKNKIISSMAKQVAHDIRSPLSTLNLLSSSSSQTDDQNHRLVLDSIKQINNIANELLNRAKEIDGHVVESRVSEKNNGNVLNLKQALRDVVSEKEIQNKDSEISLKSEILISSEVSINFSETDFKRVLSNILNNSFEAVDRGGTIIVSAQSYDDVVIIRVSDNGKGMPEDILKKLGDVEISYGKSQLNAGSGLGVFHAKQTVEKYGGSFTVHSKLAQGTIVTLQLVKAK